MRKLDRLGWAEGISFTSFGVCVGVRVNAFQVLHSLLRFLPPGWKESRRTIVDRLYSLAVGGNCERPGLRRLNVLYGDFVGLARDESLEQVLNAFEADLHQYVAANSAQVTFLHAGVVEWQGRAIVIPGRTFSGKTTLVRELLRLGATYYSDEFAVVDDAGLVHPFPRPLGIREKGSSSRCRCSAEELGATIGLKPLRASLIVIGKYSVGGRWQPAPLSHGEGALELLANSIGVRSYPEQTLSRIHKLVRNVKFVRGDRGEACGVAEAVLNLSARTERQLCA